MNVRTLDDIASSLAHHPMHVAFDVAAIATVLGAWAQVIPTFAALAAALWYTILIWESNTVRGWTGRAKRKGKASND